VESSDGQEVGTVKRVMIVEEKDLFDGIVVTTPNGDRFVDAPEVDDLYERLVTLKIDSAAAERLPEPGANPAAMRVDPRDTVRGSSNNIARRIWDRISGRY
jgi:sporulation protein YlmC with PRC-barrel domain